MHCHFAAFVFFKIATRTIFRGYSSAPNRKFAVNHLACGADRFDIFQRLALG